MLPVHADPSRERAAMTPAQPAERGTRLPAFAAFATFACFAVQKEHRLGVSASRVRDGPAEVGHYVLRLNAQAPNSEPRTPNPEPRTEREHEPRTENPE